MRTGIRNGTEIGYDLREVAAMLGHRDTGYAEGRALIQQLADYFRRQSLVERFNVGGGYDVVSGGAIRAYCYDHDLSVPRELLGTASSAEEVPALMRKMLRERAAVSEVVPEVLPGQPVAAQEGERKHGGARPEVEYIERYVSECQQRGLTLLAMKKGFVRYVRERLYEGDQSCPFIAYDPTLSIFTVWGAARVRELPLANAHRSIGSAHKKLSAVSKCKQVRHWPLAADSTMAASHSDGGLP